MRPKKHLGQNFLRDANILRKEASIAGITGKNVLEIGAGDGRLTEKILEQNPAKVYAVEKDRELVALLRKKFSSEQRVEVIEGDFLEMGPFPIDAILGNIPYYISSSIIFRLKNWMFKNAVMMVQKEFAERMVAKPNKSNYGRLSVTGQLAFDIKLVQTVPRHLFYPAPRVDSAVIKLVPTKTSLSQFEEEIIRKLFQHKNKTVRNALKEYGLEDGRRVRTLTKEDCLEIAKKLSHGEVC